MCNNDGPGAGQPSMSPASPMSQYQLFHDSNGKFNIVSRTQNRFADYRNHHYRSAERNKSADLFVREKDSKETQILHARYMDSIASSTGSKPSSVAAKPSSTIAKPSSTVTTPTISKPNKRANKSANDTQNPTKAKRAKKSVDVPDTTSQVTNSPSMGHPSMSDSDSLKAQSPHSHPQPNNAYNGQQNNSYTMLDISTLSSGARQAMSHSMIVPLPMQQTSFPPITAESHVKGHLISLNNAIPYDLDLDSLQGGLDCDVDSIIRHELNVDGNLDFNFEHSMAHAHAHSMNSSFSGHAATHGVYSPVVPSGSRDR